VEEIEPDQKIQADVAQVGCWPVEPVQERGTAGSGQGVDFAWRPVRLGFGLSGQQAGLLQLLEVGIELAQPDLPHPPQLAAEILIEFVAMPGPGHQQPQQGRLWPGVWFAGHSASSFEYSQPEYYPDPGRPVKSWCLCGKPAG